MIKCKGIEFTSEHEMLNNPILIKFFDYNTEYLKMFILMEMQHIETKREERQQRREERMR